MKKDGGRNCISALDSVVDNALACHLCDPGSKPGQGMWLGSGRPSRLGGIFPGTVYFIEWSHGVESWIGVMEWSIGVNSWSGTLE